VLFLGNVKIETRVLLFLYLGVGGSYSMIVVATEG